VKIHVLPDLVLLALAITLWTSLGLAQTPTITRIQETDKSITYTGAWYVNGDSSDSGGSATLANAPGATATVNFTGTGITWIGVLDSYSGLANVYLDGAMTTVDTYTNGTFYQQALFTATGLTNGPHTLAIEVTHTMDPNGLGAWVWIDAFDIQNGAPVTGGFTSSTAYAGRTEQNSPAVSYTGTWYTNASAVLSGNSAAFASAAGSSATIAFSGTSITWIGYRDANSGLAQVYVDGVPTATVDTYLSPVETQTPVYSVNGLVPGPHTLAIVVTGSHNPASGGSWVWVDAFDVGSGSPGSSTDLAQAKAATQSSTYPYAGTGAASAVDGSTDGNFFDGSVATTNLDTNAWWQVDLGASAAIRSIVIWNRTDCCGSRLNDYWVFVSDTPFSPTDTPTTLALRPGTWSSHQTATPSPSAAIAAGAQGRYVRVQLTGANYLSLAEVQVLQ
jgi:hypothetical protein